MLGVFNKLLKDEDGQRWVLAKLLSSDTVVEIYVTEPFTAKKCTSYYVLNNCEDDSPKKIDDFVKKSVNV